MAQVSQGRRIWGWYFFDWASQPYATLLLTFIFAPYIAELLQDGARAQAVWGYGVAAAGFLIAVSAPVIGAIADRAGGRRRFVWLFSALYVLGAWGLWYAAPGEFSLIFVLCSFGLGLIGLEFATIFTNAMLPDLGTQKEVGKISGDGWALGYVGGVLALALMLVFFQETPSGKTLIGLDPVLGLDPATREGTRAVGPFTAIWYVIFMVPFFLWVHEPRAADRLKIGQAVKTALPELRQTLRHLPDTPSLFAYLASSMFYRDALSGIYTFGGIYAVGVLGWTPVDMGVFGILAAITGAVAAWVGGRADRRYGPKPVIVTSLLILVAVAIMVTQVSREAVLFMPVEATSKLPDLAFYVLGALIGSAGGALGASSRSMMVRQANPHRMTEAFGLFALAGKATSFLAPFLIAVVTDFTGSQQMGITPLIALFLLGLVLLRWVKPNGEEASTWSARPS